MRRFVLPLILILAFLLRVLWLDRFPMGFTPDEASFGYDAYSLLKTGKDQWGHTLPLFLESFGDFKPPLYAYLTIPSVAIFGLTKFATRLPNALFGTVAVYVVYLLVKEILSFYFISLQNDGKKKNLAFSIEHLTLTASFLLAVSPWHIMLSRGAFEANLTTFFLPLGILLFLKSIDFVKDSPRRAGTVLNKTKNQKYLIWSAFVFGLNLFTYHSARVVTPLIILILVWLWGKKLLRNCDKYTSLCSAIHYHKIPIIVFFVFSMVGFYTLFQGGAVRAKDLSIANGALEEQASGRLEAINNGLNPTIARLIHNKYRIIAKRFVNNYKQYFSYKFLFSEGSAEATYGMIPGMGVLHSIELLALVGFVVAFIKNKTNKVLQLIIFWLVAAPIPASLTMGVGYAANRVSIMMPAIQIASGIGFVWIYNFAKQKLSKQVVKLSIVGLGLIIVASVLLFTREYFVSPPHQSSKSMLSGNLESAYWLAENSSNESKIIVSTKLSEPHIYIAFANEWDPEDYQNQTVGWEKYKDEGCTFLDQLGSYNLGKYIFTRIDDMVLQNKTGTLLVGRPDEFPEGVGVVKQFNYSDGSPAVLMTRMNNLYAKKIN